MAGRIPNELRDQAIALFRERVTDKMGITLFPHQASWWAASTGHVLERRLAEPGEPSRRVKLPDESIEHWALTERPSGHARFIADLGAFKIGKSFSSALWATGFAAIPDARVSLVGLEYDICAPEFDYLCDFLLSEAGMGLKYDSLQNRPRDGKMWLDLVNGCRFEARSWERKDSLKGKEIDCYVYCEAYQLPGIECFTSFSQNLRVRRGYALFATTPDRPWVKLLHEMGHGADPEWHCTCGIDAAVNPYSYDATARVRDEKLMTREKFSIHYGGQLGDFVGQVFNYQKGEALATPERFPALFDRAPDDSRLPPGWVLISAADTGTFYTALSVAFSPEGDAVVMDEFPNYRYVAGEPERDEGITIPQWARGVERRITERGGRVQLWADRNSQFKRELAMYGIQLMPSTLPLETRTEITREYFQHGRVFLMPGLSVLPFELENAAWPDDTTAAGRFARVKDRDHTLDCLEHILSRRPTGSAKAASAGGARWIDTFLGGSAKLKGAPADPHMGAN